jgi:aminoglycoside 6-adenylyltransferase
VSDAFLERLVEWAARQPDVRALVLTGSRARADGRVDDVSDYDLEVLTTEPARYATPEWMDELGPVWVYLPTTRSDDERYMTRLVVFAEAVKVDFSFAPPDLLEDMVAARKLSPLYERGYRVLLDRDGLAARLPEPSGRPTGRTLPTEAELRAAVEEFWFEASHIPKLLKRGELWVVKQRDWAMKELLLQMIEWHALAASGGKRDVWHIGTRMAEWAQPGVWERLHEAFGGFGAAESRRALLATTALYSDLGRETAAALGHAYPAEVDAAISAYVGRV